MIIVAEIIHNNDIITILITSTWSRVSIHSSIFVRLSGKKCVMLYYSLWLDFVRQ